MDFENIAVRCETYEERLQAISFLEKMFSCVCTIYAKNQFNFVKYVYYEKNTNSDVGPRIFGLIEKPIRDGKILDDYERRNLTIVPFLHLFNTKELEEYCKNLKIQIRFNNFHSAVVSRAGIRFPWREAIFPVEIVKQLIEARKKCEII